jgi:hypothetical protein
MEVPDLHDFAGRAFAAQRALRAYRHARVRVVVKVWRRRSISSETHRDSQPAAVCRKNRRELERSRACRCIDGRPARDDPLTYAARWLRREWLPSSSEYGSALDRWLNYYRTCGIEAFASGCVLVRKRRGVNWFQALSVGAEMHGFCGEQPDRLLRIQDYCAAHLRSDEDLLDCRLTLQAHRLDQVLHFQSARYQLHSSVLRLHDNMPFPIGIDGFRLQVLSKCDGRHTLRKACADSGDDWSVRRLASYLPAVARRA